MGNRAVIAFGTKPESPAVYVHWNGGWESITAFLEVASEWGYAGLLDVNKQAEGVASIIQNFFGETTKVDVGVLEELDTDNWDNGTYYVKAKEGAFWIVERSGKVNGVVPKDYSILPFSQEYYEGVLEEVHKQNPVPVEEFAS